MRNKNKILKKIEHLTDEQKQKLFDVKELETRLEMAAFSISNTPIESHNDGCTTDSSCGW
jgi:hypothetical protein